MEKQETNYNFLFQLAVLEQMQKNQDKWGNHHDNQHTYLEWAAIAAEQVGQLITAVLNNDLQGVKREAIHTAAVCEEVYTRIKKAEDDKERIILEAKECFLRGSPD